MLETVFPVLTTISVLGYWDSFQVITYLMFTSVPKMWTPPWNDFSILRRGESHKDWSQGNKKAVELHFPFHWPKTCLLNLTCDKEHSCDAITQHPIALNVWCLRRIFENFDSIVDFSPSFSDSFLERSRKNFILWSDSSNCKRVMKAY